MKFDAFGGRLWNILNAYRVAEALGARMRFAWPERPLDGVRPAEETFAPEFIAEHLVAEVDITKYRHVRIWKPKDVAEIRRSAAIVWYESKHKDRRFDKYEVGSNGFRFLDLPSFEEAFMKVRFRTSLEAIRREAQRLDPFQIAIHVRRGDVFNGDFRFGNHFVDKAIPAPLVRELILAAAPARVLLVGNDLSGLAIRGLADLPNVFIASEVVAVDEEDELEAIMRDFCLMTRCEQIVAGNSLFAILPARIARAQLKTPSEAIELDRQRELLWASITGDDVLPDLETALTCNYLMAAFGSDLREEEIEFALSTASRADPSNPSLVIACAARHLLAGDLERAEAVFYAASTNSVPETCVRLLKNSFNVTGGVGFPAVTGGFLREADWESLTSHSQRSPWAAFYSALKEASSGRVAGARALLEFLVPIEGLSPVREAIETISALGCGSAVREAFAFSTDPGPGEGLHDPEAYHYTHGLKRTAADE